MYTAASGTDCVSVYALIMLHGLRLQNTGKMEKKFRLQGTWRKRTLCVLVHLWKCGGFQIKTQNCRNSYRKCEKSRSGWSFRSRISRWVFRPNLLQIHFGMLCVRDIQSFQHSVVSCIPVWAYRIYIFCKSILQLIIKYRTKTVEPSAFTVAQGSWADRPRIVHWLWLECRI